MAGQVGEGIESPGHRRAKEGGDYTYPWAKSYEEERRAFVLSCLANHELDLKSMIAMMAEIDYWLEHGSRKEDEPKSKLRVIKE